MALLNNPMGALLALDAASRGRPQSSDKNCSIDCDRGSGATSCPSGMKCCKKGEKGNPVVGCVYSWEACDRVFSPPDVFGISTPYQPG